MTDCEMLVNALRKCAETDDPVDSCETNCCSCDTNERSPMCRQFLMQSAANCIEELFFLLQGYRDRRSKDALP